MAEGIGGRGEEFGDIELDLLGQGAGIGEFLFRTKKAMELEVDLLAAKGLGKIRKMSFHFSLLPAKGGASSQIDRGGSLTAIWQDGLTGVHAVGW